MINKKLFLILPCIVLASSILGYNNNRRPNGGISVSFPGSSHYDSSKNFPDHAFIAHAYAKLEEERKSGWSVSVTPHTGHNSSMPSMGHHHPHFASTHNNIQSFQASSHAAASQGYYPGPSFQEVQQAVQNYCKKAFNHDCARISHVLAETQNHHMFLEYAIQHILHSENPLIDPGKTDPWMRGYGSAINLSDGRIQHHANYFLSHCYSSPCPASQELAQAGLQALYDAATDEFPELAAVHEAIAQKVSDLLQSMPDSNQPYQYDLPTPTQADIDDLQEAWQLPETLADTVETQRATQRCQALAQGDAVDRYDFVLTEQTHGFLLAHGHNPNIFTYIEGTCIQAQLSSELVDILNKTTSIHEHATIPSTIYNKQTVRMIQQQLTYSCDLSQQYNKAQSIHAASSLTDLSWALYDYGHAFISGLALGANNFAESVLHPIDTIVNTAHLLKNIGYYTVAASYETSKLVYYKCFDEELYAQQYNDMATCLQHVYASTCQALAETSGPDRLKYITAFATEMILPVKTARVIRFASKFAGSHLLALREYVQPLEKSIPKIAFKEATTHQLFDAPKFASTAIRTQKNIKIEKKL